MFEVLGGYSKAAEQSYEYAKLYNTYLRRTCTALGATGRHQFLTECRSQFMKTKANFKQYFLMFTYGNPFQ